MMTRRTVGANKEMHVSMNSVGSRYKLWLAALSAPVLGWVAMEYAPVNVLNALLGGSIAGDLAWLGIGFGMGFLLGHAFPRYWFTFPFLAVSFDMTALIIDISRSDVSLWPIGVFIRMLWLCAAIAGSFLGSRWSRRIVVTQQEHDPGDGMREE
jgi:hypothetical protein